MGNIELYTDGSCWPNPGPGAWSVIIVENGKPITLTGTKRQTTNNEMEITGILRAMEWIWENRIEGATIFSDSQYAIGCVSVWSYAWRKKEWKKAGGPIKNLMLIQQAHDLHQRTKPKIRWVKGHNGHKWNEMADKAAEMAREALDIRPHEPRQPEIAIPPSMVFFGDELSLSP